MQMTDGLYWINNIPEGSYQLSFGFKSFQVYDTLDIKDDTLVSYTLPAIYNLTISAYNIYGMIDEEGIIRITRGPIVEDSNIESVNSTVYLPPAQYVVEIVEDQDTIARLPVNIRSDKTIEIITNRGSFMHMALWISVSLVTLVVALFFVIRKRYESAVYCVIIGLLISSLAFPWWSLNGSNDEMETQTNLMLMPGTIVAYTNTDEFYAGELQIVPDEVPLALTIFTLSLLASSLLIGIGIALQRRFAIVAKYLLLASVVISGIVLVVFLYLLSQLTVLGVGSIVGEDTLSISVPGQQAYAQVVCFWGPSIGFFLAVSAVVLLLVWILGIRRLFMSRNEQLDSRDKKIRNSS
jgi:hypothetical protein